MLKKNNKSTKQLELEIDMDGVLVDIHSYIEKKVREEGYSSFSFDDVKKYDLSGDIGVPRSVVKKYFLSEDVFLNSEPMAGAVEFMAWVKSLPEVFVTLHTFCASGIVSVKSKWVAEHFGLDNLIICADTDVEDKIMLKSDIVVEDCLSNLKASSSPTKVLFSRPYNSLEHNADFTTLFDSIEVIPSLSGLRTIIERELQNL